MKSQKVQPVQTRSPQLDASETLLVPNLSRSLNDITDNDSPINDKIVLLNNDNSESKKFSEKFVNVGKKMAPNKLINKGLKLLDQDEDEEFEEEPPVQEEQNMNKTLKIDHVSGEEAYSHLNFYEQAQLSDKITNSVVTPFNAHKFVQLLPNPEKEGQILAVQLVHRSLQYSKAKIKMKITDYSKLSSEQKSKVPPHKSAYKCTYDTTSKFCSFNYDFSLMQSEESNKNSLLQRKQTFKAPYKQRKDYDNKREKYTVEFSNDTPYDIWLYNYDKYYNKVSENGQLVKPNFVAFVECYIGQEVFLYSGSEWHSPKKESWSKLDTCDIKTHLNFDEDQPIGCFECDATLAANQRFQVFCSVDTENQTFAISSSHLYVHLNEYQEAEKINKKEIFGTCPNNHQYMNEVNVQPIQAFIPLQQRKNGRGLPMRYDEESKKFYCGETLGEEMKGTLQSFRFARASPKSRTSRKSVSKKRRKTSKIKTSRLSEVLQAEQADTKRCEPRKKSLEGDENVEDEDNQCQYCRSDDPKSETDVMYCACCEVAIDTAWRDQENYGKWFICEQQKRQHRYLSGCVSCSDCMQKRLTCQKLEQKTKLQHFYTKHSFKPQDFTEFSNSDDKKERNLHCEEDYVDAGSTKEQSKIWAIISLWEQTNGRFEFLKQWRVQDPVFMNHKARNGLPELLTVDEGSVKFFSREKTNDQNSKEVDQWVVNELELKEVSKANSQHKKKMFYSNTTRDYDKQPCEDEQDNRKRLPLPINSGLAQSMEQAFNSTNELFKWPKIASKIYLGFFDYEKDLPEKSAFKVYNIQKDNKQSCPEIVIRNSGIVLAHIFDDLQQQMTIYSISAQDPSKLLIDFFTHKKMKEQTESKDNEFNRMFEMMNWQHDDCQQIELFQEKHNQILSNPDFVRQTHNSKSRLNPWKVKDIQIKSEKETGAKSFAVIFPTFYFKFDLNQKDNQFTIENLQIDISIQNQLFIGNFQSIKNFDKNTEVDEDVDQGAFKKDNYTFKYLNLQDKEKKEKMQITVQSDLKLDLSKIYDFRVVQSNEEQQTQQISFIYYNGKQEPVLCFAQAKVYEQANATEFAKEILSIYRPPDFYEKYPILLQPTQEPACDKLMIANLATNQKQVQIDLSPYKFLCVAEKSALFDSKMKTSIDILASYQDLGTGISFVCLLRIQIPLWSEDYLDQQQLFKIQKICKVPLPENKEEFPDQLIKQCFIFQKKGKKGLEPVHMMLKYQKEQSSIVTFNLNNSKGGPKKKDALDDLPLYMLAGPFQDAYYVQRDRNDQLYKIFCCSVNSTQSISKLEQTIAFEHPYEIKAIQWVNTETTVFSDQRKITMAVIDSKNELFLLEKMNKPGRFKVVKSFDLRGQISLFNEENQLESFPYSRSCFGERLVFAPIFGQQNSEDFCKIFKHDSQTVSQFRFNGFLNLQSQNEYNDQRLISIQSVNMVKKLLCKIQEGNFGYFLTLKNPETNKIDLMSIKHQLDSSESFYFVMNHAILHFDENQKVVRQFNRKTMILEKIYSGFSQIRILQSQNQLNDCAVIWDENSSNLKLIQFKGQNNEIMTLSSDDAKILIEILRSQLADIIMHNDGTFSCITLKEQIMSKRHDKKLNAQFKEAFSLMNDLTGDVLELDIDQENEEKEVKVILNQTKKIRLKDSNNRKIFQHFDFMLPVKINTACSMLVVETKNKFALTFNNEQVIYFNKVEVMNLKNQKPLKSLDESGQIIWYNRQPSGNVQDHSITQNEVNIQYHNVPVNQWFSSNYFADGIRIDQVNNLIRGQVEGITKSNPSGNTLRQDMIQISLPDQVLIWDLVGRNEIQHMMESEKHTVPQNFVRTQFLLYRIPDAKKRNFAKEQHLGNYRLYCNLNQTLWSFPAIEDDERACLIQTFSEFDIMELLYLHENEKKITNDIVDTNIDVKTILSDVYGLTIVQAFLNNTPLLQNINEKITKTVDSDMQGDENHADGEDHPLLAKLYLILKLKRLKFKVDNPQLDLKSWNSKDWAAKEKLFIKRYSSTDTKKPLPDHICFKKIDTKHVCRSRKSALQYCLVDKDAANRFQDNLIQLLLLAKTQMNLADLVANYEAFMAVFNESFHSIDQFLEDSWLTTPMTEEVDELPWVEGKKVLTFNANTTLLSERQIRLQAERAASKFWRYRLRKSTKSFLDSGYTPNWARENLEPAAKIRPKRVEVKIYDVNYLLKALNQFYKDIKISGDEKIYRNELVNAFLWQQDYTGPISLVFVAYLCQILVTWVYFYYYVPSPHPHTWPSETGAGWLKVAVVLLLAHQCVHEWKQISSAKLIYFLQPTNLIQLVVIGLTIWIIFITEVQNKDLADYENQQNSWQLSVLPSVAGLLQGFQLLYWMNMFEDTSFYVVLLEESFYDIKSFLVLLFICILTIGNATALLDVNTFTFAEVVQPNDGYSLIDSEEPRFTSDSGKVYPFLERIFDQYQIGLGDFQYGYQDRPYTDLFWLYFFIATFLTQIIMFNFLIAIMAATFERVMEKKELYALMARTGIYTDFKHIFSYKFEKLKNKPEKYIYVIKPVEEEEGDATEGAIALIKTKMARIERRIKQESQTNMANVTQLFRENRKLNEQRQIMLDQQLKQITERMNTLTKGIKGIDKMQKEIQFVSKAVKQAASKSPTKNRE